MPLPHEVAADRDPEHPHDGTRQDTTMAYGDNRRTPKMNKRRAQLRKKARLARKAAAAKAARGKA